ncbi:MAG: hypothetical protein HY731_02665, partial [Candidatus Tectomicrobia bacterium]|nr:hypothetical protein [Candidatus Tectomicrobia bacterium]
ASDPRNPRIVGSRNTPGNANDIKVSGNLAFIVDGSSGLQILEISDPTNPIIIGAVDTPGNAVDVVIRGNLAFLADGHVGLQIIDVSDPTNPFIVGAVDTPGSGNGVDVSPILNLAVIADGTAGVQVIDITDPARPVRRGSIDTPGGANDIVFSGIFAVVADGCGFSPLFGGLQIVDVSNPVNPSLVGSNDVRFNACDVALVGNLAFFAENLFVNAVPLVNIGNPRFPIFVGALDFSRAPSFRDDNGTGVAVSRNLLFMTGTRSTIAQNGTFGDTGLHIGQFAEFNDNGFTPPTVAVIDPGPVLEGSTVTIRVEATDDVFVNTVELLLNGAVQGLPDITAPFAFSITVPTGIAQFTLSARATDLAGNVGIAPDLVVAVVDDTPPVVSIIEPGVGAKVVEGTTLQVRVEAMDNVGVNAVSFRIEGFAPIIDATAPFEASFAVPVGARQLILEVTALDTIGQVGSALRVVEVTPDQPPVVTLTNPVDGAEVISGTTISLQATAQDDLGVASVQFFQQGSLTPISGLLLTPPFVANFFVPAGTAGTTLAIVAVAIDTVGHQTTSDPAIVDVVASQPPSIAITSPENGASAVEGETLTLRANATDDFGIVSVEFVVNGASVETIPGPGPFEADFVVPAGVPALTIDAIATDTSGQQSTDSVVVTIILDPGTTVAGVVVDSNGVGVEGAEVTLGTLSATTESDGLFSISGVPTLQDIIVSVTFTTPEGQILRGSSAQVPPVRGGITDVGTIVLVTAAFEEEIGVGLNQSDDDFDFVAFTQGFTFPFFGTIRTGVFIGSNGYLTFGAGDTDFSESVSDFLGPEPRIAIFFDDLNPGASGDVFVNQFPDRFVVTYNGVPEFSSTGSNTFQIILFNDGRVQFGYRDLTARDAIVGISPGGSPAPPSVQINYSTGTPFSTEGPVAIFEQ